jgi:hypothetical protein
MRPLEADEVTERPPLPEIVQNRPPTMDQNVIERFRLHKDWQSHGWEKLGVTNGGRDFTHIAVHGAVYDVKIKRGPRKGQPNYRKPSPGTEASVMLLRQELDDWLRQWELETGHCHNCAGTGYAWSGWTAGIGTRYRPCRACDASGKPAPVEHAEQSE